MSLRAVQVRPTSQTRNKVCSISLFKTDYLPSYTVPVRTHPAFGGPRLAHIHRIASNRLLAYSQSLNNTRRSFSRSAPQVKRKMATIHEPTEEEAFTLFEEVEAKFPHKTVGEELWYLVVLSALVGVEPEHAVHLYNYLIKKPQFTSPESRQTLVRRLREVLVKDVSILGVCKPLEALFSIAKIERPEDKDYSFSRENFQTGPETLERGNNWLNTLYQSNLSTATNMFAAHKDFDYISRQITYGFYLSDHTILGPVETELVTLTGIMIQNLPLETAWHLRGTRRLGVSLEDVELVQQCVEMVAKYGGARTNRLPRVTDIEHEL